MVRLISAPAFVFLLAGSLLSHPAAAGRAVSSALVSDPAQAARVIQLTLISGDRVAMRQEPGREPVFSAEPGPGRVGTGFASIREPGGDDLVIPGDYLERVLSGRVDRRLFDVSLLLRSGYRDARRAAAALARTVAVVRRPAAAAGTVKTWPLKVIAINRAGHAVITTAVLDKIVCGPSPFCRPAGRMLVRTGAVTRVPAGSYSVFAFIRTGAGQTVSTTMASLQFNVGASTTILLDARKAKLIRVLVVDQPTAAPAQVVTSIYPVAGLRFSYQAAGAQPVYVLPYYDPDVLFTVTAVLTKKGSTADSPSPYVYAPFPWIVDHNVPASPTFRIRTSALVATRTTYRAQGIAAVANIGDNWNRADAGALWNFNARLPATITWYRTPGEVYRERVTMGGPAGTPGSSYLECGEQSNPCQDREVFNAAVVGPSAADPAGGSRTGDTISYNAIWQFFDDPSHLGTDNNWTGTLTLASNGTVIEQTGQHSFDVTVPSAQARYALTVDAQRTAAYATLSSHVQSIWTFTSGHTDFQDLPLQYIRYAPAGLNDMNQAAAGRSIEIPLWVERNPGGAPADVAAITVEASADDGATWQQLPLTKTATGWVTTLINPASPGYVSLRATVIDGAGNTSKQTIIHAYQVT